MDRSLQHTIGAGWLGLLAEPLSSAILAAGRWHTFSDRQVIYGVGVEERSLWGIEAGPVRMHVAIGEEEPRFCHVVGRGFWFGELELLTGLPRVIEMEAAGQCRLLSLQPRDVNRLSEAHPEIWQAIARLSGLNEALAVAAVDDLMLRDARKRVAALLLRLSSRRFAFQGTPPIDVIPATQREIADAVALSRTATTSIIADFVALGAIQTGYRRIRILQPERLSDLL